MVAQTVKRLPTMQETRVRSLGWEDPLEKGMATHSSVLAWRIPWTEEPGGLQSTGPQRVGHDWVTDTFTFHKRINGEKGESGGRKRQELRCSARVPLPLLAASWLPVQQSQVPPAGAPSCPSKFLPHGLYP